MRPPARWANSLKGDCIGHRLQWRPDCLPGSSCAGRRGTRKDWFGSPIYRQRTAIAITGDNVLHQSSANIMAWSGHSSSGECWRPLIRRSVHPDDGTARVLWLDRHHPRSTVRRSMLQSAADRLCVVIFCVESRASLPRSSVPLDAADHARLSSMPASVIMAPLFFVIASAWIMSVLVTCRMDPLILPHLFAGYRAPPLHDPALSALEPPAVSRPGGGYTPMPSALSNMMRNLGSPHRMLSTMIERREHFHFSMLAGHHHSEPTRRRAACDARGGLHRTSRPRMARPSLARRSRPVRQKPL